MSATDEPAVEDPAAGARVASHERGIERRVAGPGRAVRHPRRRRAGIATAVVVGVGAFVWAWVDGPGVRVVEVGYTVVEPAARVMGDDVDTSVMDPDLSWVAVIENEQDDWVAHDVRLRVELVGEGGEDLGSFIPEIEVLAPRQRTAITGEGYLPDGAEVEDVRVEVEDVGRWDDVGGTPTALARDVTVEYGAAQQPIVGFELLGEARPGSGRREVHLVFRDRHGRILAGRTYDWEDGELPVDSRDPRRVAQLVDFTLPDLATAEVYVEATKTDA